MSVAERIRETRKNKGLTQAKLADLLGVSYVVISQYERGERNPKLETLQRIAAALDISVDYLIGRDSAKEHRVDSGVSSKEIAYELTMPEEMVIAMESGEIPMPPEFVDKYYESTERIKIAKDTYSHSLEMAMFDSLPQHIRALHSVMRFLKQYVEWDGLVDIPANTAYFYGKEPDKEYLATPEEYFLPQLPHMLKKIRDDYQNSIADKKGEVTDNAEHNETSE